MCGLFGIINKKEQILDKRAFFTLGVNNDLRGGDACGILIDGQVEYGTDKDKYFEDFFPKSKLLKATSKCRAAIGHCRKASIGGTGAHLAQPCVIYDDEGNIKFAVTHNGTIKNYTDLAKKYIPNENISGLSDSQVMTLIFYHCGYDVLQEYVGSGAFVIVDYREDEPRFLLFHGKSKEYKYSVEAKEERPLFVIETKNSLIYSSIPDFLKTLYYNHELQYIRHNLLVEFKQEGLVCVKEYDRTECFMQAVETTAVTTYTHNTKNTNIVRESDADDDYDDGYYGCYRGNNGNNAGFQQSKNNGSQENSKFLTMGDDFIVRDKMYHRVDGEFIVDIKGKIYDTVGINTSYIYVFNGIVMKNKNCYEFLSKIATTWSMSHKDFYDVMANLVLFFSPFPFKDFNITGTYLVEHFVDEDLQFGSKYTGECQKLFANQIQKYEAGVEKYQYIYSPEIKAFDVLKTCASYEIPKDIIQDYLNDFV